MTMQVCSHRVSYCVTETNLEHLRTDIRVPVSHLTVFVQQASTRRAIFRHSSVTLLRDSELSLRIN